MARRDGGRRAADSRQAAVQETAGPRQEYIDAFDDARFGRGGTGASGTAGASGDRRDPGGTGPDPVRGRPAVPPPFTGEAPPRSPVSGGSGDAAEDTRSRRKGRSRRGRALTGLGAAAVVTVLAVVIAGRVAAPPDSGASSALPESGGPGMHVDDRPQSAVSPPEPSGHRGEASGGPQEPGEGAPSGEPGFEELMESTFALDPELTASGTLDPVGGSAPPADPDAVEVVRYRVDVERGLGRDPEFFAEAVHRTLSDERSWGNDGARSFARVSSGPADFVVTLASPGTTAEWCAKSGLDTTVDNVSCNSSSTERVMINAWRWAQGSESYAGDIRGYRRMLINHEVGHRLGYGHQVCPADGALAPVMMQQTKFLTIDGLTCERNPWPHPRE